MGVGWGVEGGGWRIKMRWERRLATFGIKEKRCRKHRKQKEEHKPLPSPKGVLGY